MKRLISTLCLLAVIGNLMAGSVDQQKAQKLGAKFLSTTAIGQKNADIQLHLVSAAVDLQRSATDYYVFNVTDGEGFVIVAGDDRVKPILAYSTTGKYDPSNVSEGFQFTLDAFRTGHFEVQDLASQCVGLVCAPKPGERWLDACAGGGGKTLELAEMMKRRGTVIAGDVREGILHELKLRARRAGFPNISTLHHDGRVPRGFHPCDGVLVDAPCSGSGVWRRNPGSAWKFRLDELAEYARRQYDILSRFSAAVKSGGVLVYATCSLFAAENEEVVRRFLTAHPDFALESGVHPLTGLVSDGFYHFDGFDDDCDFLFAARLRRKFGDVKK